MPLSSSPIPQKNLIFEITTRCNHNCQHCYNVWKIPDINYPTDELSFKKIKKLLEKVIPETDCRVFTLTGGEPLLHPDFFRTIEFLNKYDLQLNLITNGTLLTENNIKWLIQHKIDIFELPLLSDKRSVHDSLSGVDGAFDKVTEAIVKIRKYGGRVILVFVATKKNIKDLEGVIKIAVALNSQGLMFNRFNVGGIGIKFMDELLPSHEELKEALALANHLSEKYSFGISSSIAIQPCLIDIEQYTNLSFGFCAAGTERSYYTIDPIGNLRICNHTPEILGNLFESSFIELATKEEVRNFVCTLPDNCLDCKIVEECQGGCKAAALVYYKTLRKADPFVEENREKSLVIM